MALSRVKTWGSELLTSSDLNAEINNILNNPISLISPLTGGLDWDGQTMTLDAAAATTLVSSAAISLNVTSGAKSGTPAAASGSILNFSAQTFTDSATAGSGTATSYAAYSLARPTLAATNASVTTTDAATFYIPNNVAAGTNETITNSWAMWIDAGNARFDDSVVVNGTTDSTSIATGSIQTDGGLGVTKALWVGGLANIAGAVTLQSTLDVTGAITGNVTGNCTGTSGSTTGNAATVTTNANLTGHVTSVGNAAVLGTFTLAQLNTAVSDGNATITLGTEQASTSGTSIDFTGIPAGVKRITIKFAGVSTNGTSNKLIQIGDVDGFEATTYLGSGAQIVDGASPGVTSYTTGFGIRSADAAGILHGTVVLDLENAAAFTWIASGTLSSSEAARVFIVSGSHSLSAELTQVRITTVNGSDAYDAGVINISYE